MLFLLPPSETKTRPAADAPHLDLPALTHPELTAARETMLRAVQRTAAGRDGGAKLGVPASAPELTERMAELSDEPVGPALRVYSGVLFDQLDPAVLDPGANAPTDRRVLIQSALLGVVDAAQDLIPAYRVSAGSKVTRLGKAGTWWGKHLRPLAQTLLEETARSTAPLAIDCRSGAYRTMMPLHSTAEVRVLAVSPVQERAGVRKVVSHDAKRYRGWVVRALLDAPSAPPTAEAVVEHLLAAFDGTLGVELDGDSLVIVDHVE